MFEDAGEECVLCVTGGGGLLQAGPSHSLFCSPRLPSVSVRSLWNVKSQANAPGEGTRTLTRKHDIPHASHSLVPTEADVRCFRLETSSAGVRPLIPPPSWGRGAAVAPQRPLFI